MINVFEYFRTNKACPLYQQTASGNSSMNASMNEDQEEEMEKIINTDDEDLVNVDGTKLKLSGKIVRVMQIQQFIHIPFKMEFNTIY